MSKADFTFEGQLKTFKKVALISFFSFILLSILTFTIFENLPDAKKEELYKSIDKIEDDVKDVVYSETSSNDNQSDPTDNSSSDETPVLDHPPGAIDIPEE